MPRGNHRMSTLPRNLRPILGPEVWPLISRGQQGVTPPPWPRSWPRPRPPWRTYTIIVITHMPNWSKEEIKWKFSYDRKFKGFSWTWNLRPSLFAQWNVEWKWIMEYFSDHCVTKTTPLKRLKAVIYNSCKFKKKIAGKNRAQILLVKFRL